MVQFNWSLEKNAELKRDLDRAVCFEDIVTALDEGRILDDIEHMNLEKYPHQRIFVVLIDGYIYAVPYVSDGKTCFLKTIYPSRKLTEIYLGKNEI